MNSTNTRSGISLRQVQIFGSRSLIGILFLCLGLWACGSGTGHEETPPAPGVPAAGPVADSMEPPVPNQDAATNSDVTHDPAFRNLPPVEAQARGTSQKAHLVLTGSQKYDADARSNCALFPNKTFQVALNIPGAPFFVLRIENFQGAGQYDADARVRANFSGEVIRQSRGAAKATITVVKSAQPGGQDAISGSFSGSYRGEAGEGTVSGSFERCLYELPEFNQ